MGHFGEACSEPFYYQYFSEVNASAWVYGFGMLDEGVKEVKMFPHARKRCLERLKQ